MYVTHRSFAAPAPAIRDFFWLYHTYSLLRGDFYNASSRPKPSGVKKNIAIFVSRLRGYSFNSVQIVHKSPTAQAINALKSRQFPRVLEGQAAHTCSVQCLLGSILSQYGYPENTDPRSSDPHYGPVPRTTYGPIHGLLLRTPYGPRPKLNKK